MLDTPAARAPSTGRGGGRREDRLEAESDPVLQPDRAEERPKRLDSEVGQPALPCAAGDEPIARALDANGHRDGPRRPAHAQVARQRAAVDIADVAAAQLDGGEARRVEHVAAEYVVTHALAIRRRHV